MNNQSILISVVVPMYNASAFIRKCIEHLIHQTYKNLEIIVVDDGSSDGCGKIIKEYIKKDKRIKLITQKNFGVSVASNVGILAAKGKYIHIHDHDDFVNLDYFEKMANVAELTDADVLCGEVNQPRFNFPVFDSIEILISLSDKILKTRTNLFNPVWRYVYKTDFLKKNNILFEQCLRGDQDVIFSKKSIILADKVATVPKAIYNVIDTPTALGKINKTNNIPTKEQIDIWNKWGKFVKEHNAEELLNTPEYPYHIDYYTMFRKNILKRCKLTKEEKIYLFGIRIIKKYID